MRYLIGAVILIVLVRVGIEYLIAAMVLALLCWPIVPALLSWYLDNKPPRRF